ILASAGADSTVIVNGQMLTIGSRAAGFSLLEVNVDSESQRLQLNAIFDLPSAGLRVTRHYAIADRSPSFEVWTTYSPTTSSPTLTDLNSVQLTVTGSVVHSLTGLQGDSADVPSDGAFTLQQRTLASGGRFAIGAEGRGAEQYIPWVAIDDARDE